MLNEKTIWISPTKKILVVSCYPQEIELIWKKDPIVNKKSLGVGNLEAALNLEELISHVPKIDGILLLGGAGAYSWARLSIGDFVFSDNISSYGMGATMRFCRHIQGNRIDKLNQNFFPTSPLIAKEWKEVLTNAPPEVTIQQMEKPPLVQWSEFHVENTEAYGLAKVCKRRSIPFLSINRVTHIVGPEGYKQWTNNWRSLVDQLQVEIQKLMDFHTET